VQPAVRQTHCEWRYFHLNTNHYLKIYHYPKAPPLNNAVIVAISQLVDDAQTERRDPSHSDLEFLIKRHGLTSGDPNSQGQTVGKAKRVRGTLSWALEHSLVAGGEFVYGLISQIQGHGGFRESVVVNV